MSIHLISDKQMNRTISGHRGVRTAVKAKAQEIHSNAGVLMHQHTDEGFHRVSLKKAGRTDWLVVIEDRDPDGANALAAETGHDDRSGDDVQALDILKRAAGLV